MSVARVILEVAENNPSDLHLVHERTYLFLTEGVAAEAVVAALVTDAVEGSRQEETVDFGLSRRQLRLSRDILQVGVVISFAGDEDL